MLTKFYIEIDGTRHEIPQHCVKNWDEVKCAYKRVDYSGITRSFTSQFEFVNEAYDMILNLYLRDGFNAVATLYLYTITDRWEWEERFAAPIDFSSLSWDSHILKVNCIDNSLAACIKSRKSTKYEFIVGQDIPISDVLHYDRIIMTNTCTHEIMGDGVNDFYGDHVDVCPSELASLPTYSVGESEIFENSPILFQDQTDEDGSYFLEAIKDVNGLKIDIEISTEGTRGIIQINGVNITLRRFPRYSSHRDVVDTVFHYEGNGPERTYLGVFSTLEELKRVYPNPAENSYAFIGNNILEVTAAYVMPIGNYKEWVPGVLNKYLFRGEIRNECKTVIYKNTYTFDKVSSGECFGLYYECSISNRNPNVKSCLAVKSNIKTVWTSRAKQLRINALKPESIITALIDKISDGKINIRPHIDYKDPRVAKTYILAAESVRNIRNAKFYSTFQDFCNWMLSVFGYTYYLGDARYSRFRCKEDFDLLINPIDIKYVDGDCPAEHVFNVNYLPTVGAFVAFNDNDVCFYSRWPATSKWKACDEYNDMSTNRARTDKVFLEYNSGKAYYFEENGDIMIYEEDPERCSNITQDIYFVHRSDLFDNGHVITLNNVRDMRYGIDKDFVISNVVAGYDKQDYEQPCGRDEWNFSIQYNTGVDLAEKKTELLSKYRADCYGLEFVAQKGSEASTDNKSDNAIFFVHCKESIIQTGEGDDVVESRFLEIDRSVPIQGALTDTVFNGEYSPVQCIKANECYLSAIRRGLVLKFASMDGNTDIRINGMPINSDVVLSDQLFTAGELEFSTGDIDIPIDPTALYRVVTDGCIYLGYLKEANVTFSTNEAVKYKLIVKDIVR